MQATEAADPVVVEALSKTYPGPIEALRGISFRVRQGEVFGLLGPNGAGKTTTIGILTTLVGASAGAARVGGHDVHADPLAVRRSIGVVFQESVLDTEFTGAENLWLHARLWGVPDARERIASLLAAVGLAERAGDLVRTYSGGMRRRLEIARALLADPQVIVLDEPTLGLDPIARRNLWEVIRMLRRHYGVSILLSTHYLEEAQDVCDRVAIIDRGRIVAQGDPATLVSELGGEIVELVTDGDGAAVRASLAALDPALGKALVSGTAVSIASHDDRRALTRRVNALPLAELGVTTMTIRPATLNDVFLHLTAGERDGDLVGALRAASR
jgi:ABC-2 type transport system ATP-binding protein